jgi:hypothetical protein
LISAAATFSKVYRPKWGEHYLNEVLAALARFQNPSSPPALDIKNLAIACHSGGGAGMRNLLGTLGKYQPKLKECWGFDCLYGTDFHADSAKRTRWFPGMMRVFGLNLFFT